MIHRDLHELISQIADPDLVMIIEHLGEACEIRQPVYVAEATESVFANAKRFADELEYSEPVEASCLLVPTGGQEDPSRATDLDDPTSVHPRASEPMRALVTPIVPKERAMLSVLRNNVPKHYYVLQRALLTKYDPKIIQCYVVPVNLEDLSEDLPA